MHNGSGSPTTWGNLVFSGTKQPQPSEQLSRHRSRLSTGGRASNGIHQHHPGETPEREHHSCWAQALAALCPAGTEPVCDWLPPIWPSQGDISRDDAFRSSKALCSLRVLSCQLHCCCATVSVPLCEVGTGTASFLCDAHPGFPKPWINWDGPWARWRLRSLRLHISSGRRALSPQALILKAGPITIWGNAGFLDFPLPSLRAVMRQEG